MHTVYALFMRSVFLPEIFSFLQNYIQRKIDSLVPLCSPECRPNLVLLPESFSLSPSALQLFVISPKFIYRHLWTCQNAKTIYAIILAQDFWNVNSFFSFFSFFPKKHEFLHLKMAHFFILKTKKKRKYWSWQTKKPMIISPSSKGALTKNAFFLLYRKIRPIE